MRVVDLVTTFFTSQVMHIPNKKLPIFLLIKKLLDIVIPILHDKPTGTKAIGLVRTTIYLLQFDEFPKQLDFCFWHQPPQESSLMA